MKLIIIGQSQSGKTTLAKQIAHAYGFQHISASDWVKQIWHQSVEDFPSRENYIKAITEYSLECLRKHPDACVDYISDRLDSSSKIVIDGIRNPHDFVKLFNWKCDRCLHLIHQHPVTRTNSFEQGLSVIQAYLNWLLDNHLIQPDQAMTVSFQAFRTIDHPNSLEQALQQLSLQFNEGCHDSL